MINISINSSLKFESIDTSHIVLIKKLIKCEANSEFEKIFNQNYKL